MIQAILLGNWIKRGTDSVQHQVVLDLESILSFFFSLHLERLWRFTPSHL